MKRGFIRLMFGDCSKNYIRTDIDRSIKTEHTPEFVTYVFGDDNYKFAKEINVNPILISHNPVEKDLEKYLFWHKLEAYRYAMEEDGYDEIVFLDWDCLPTRPLPSDFWEVLGKKEKIQGCAYTLRRRMSVWRGGVRDGISGKNGACQGINAGFLYMRDKTVPSALLKIWESGVALNQINDEAQISYYIDQMMGGWVGLEKWWDLFEPEWCNLEKKMSYPIEKLNTKNICFIHKWM